MKDVIVHLYDRRISSRYTLYAAPLRDRIIAQLIDGIILGTLCSLLMFAFSGGQLFSIWVAPIVPQFFLQVADNYVSQPEAFWWGGAFYTLQLPYMDTLFLNYPSPLQWSIYAAYYTVFTGKYGQTPGKMFKRIVVQRRDDQFLNFRMSLQRWAASMISFLPLGMGIWPTLTSGQLTWHDRMLQTDVLGFDKKV